MTLAPLLVVSVINLLISLTASTLAIRRRRMGPALGLALLSFAPS
jgi:hypothetical protein